MRTFYVRTTDADQAFAHRRNTVSRPAALSHVIRC